MTAPIHDDHVFSKPSVPENTWQLLSWLVFEPILLQHYSATLSKKQTVAILLRTYAWLVLIILAIYLLGCFVIVAVDTPYLFPTQYRKEFINHYCELTNFEQKFIFVVKENIVELKRWPAFLLVVGLGIGYGDGLGDGLAAAFGFGIIFGIEDGLANGIANGILKGLIDGITVGLGFGFFFGSASGLNYFFVFGIVGGVVLGLVLGLALGLGDRLAEGLTVGFYVGIGWYLSYFRFCFYPFHFIRSLFGVTFYASPYHKDAVIWLPLWEVKKQFRRLALATREDALKFVRFLREYRPLQTKLADSIAHAACAGSWLNQPLGFESLEPPLIENDKLKPSEDWLNPSS